MPYSLSISRVQEKFDDNLNLIDDRTKKRIKKFLDEFKEFIGKFI